MYVELIPEVSEQSCLFSVVYELRKLRLIYAYGLFKNLDRTLWMCCFILVLIDLISLIQPHYLKKNPYLRKTVLWQVSELFPPSG